MNRTSSSPSGKRTASLEKRSEKHGFSFLPAEMGGEDRRVHQDRRIHNRAAVFSGRGNSGRSIVRELERERSRIALELHAGAGQPLAGMKLNLEMLSDCSGELPKRGREAIARLMSLTAEALAQVRAVSHSLHPPEWQQLNCEAALRTLIDSSGLTNWLDVELDFSRVSCEPPHAAKITLYRCAQECISNVARHSRATRLELSLCTTGEFVQLEIADNGCGFTSSDPGPSLGSGIGLAALREHAGHMGGTCGIATGPAGTTITVRIPFAEE